MTRAGAAQPLDSEALAHAVASLDGWQASGGALTRTAKLGAFADVIAAVTRIGFAAERADHHPDINIRYRELTLRLTTHDLGSVITTLDVALATEIDIILAGYSG